MAENRGAGIRVSPRGQQVLFDQPFVGENVVADDEHQLAGGLRNPEIACGARSRSFVPDGTGRRNGTRARRHRLACPSVDPSSTTSTSNSCGRTV